MEHFCLQPLKSKVASTSIAIRRDDEILTNPDELPGNLNSKFTPETDTIIVPSGIVLFEAK